MILPSPLIFNPFENIYNLFFLKDKNMLNEEIFFKRDYNKEFGFAMAVQNDFISKISASSDVIFTNRSSQKDMLGVEFSEINKFFSTDDVIISNFGANSYFSLYELDSTNNNAFTPFFLNNINPNSNSVNVENIGFKDGNVCYLLEADFPENTDKFLFKTFASNRFGKMIFTPFVFGGGIHFFFSNFKNYFKKIYSEELMPEVFWNRNYYNKNYLKRLNFEIQKSHVTRLLSNNGIDLEKDTPNVQNLYLPKILCFDEISPSLFKDESRLFDTINEKYDKGCFFTGYGIKTKKINGILTSPDNDTQDEHVSLYQVLYNTYIRTNLISNVFITPEDVLMSEDNNDIIKKTIDEKFNTLFAIGVPYTTSMFLGYEYLKEKNMFNGKFPIEALYDRNGNEKVFPNFKETKASKNKKYINIYRFCDNAKTFLLLDDDSFEKNFKIYEDLCCFVEITSYECGFSTVGMLPFYGKEHFLEPSDLGKKCVHSTFILPLFYLKYLVKKKVIKKITISEMIIINDTFSIKERKNLKENIAINKDLEFLTKLSCFYLNPFACLTERFLFIMYLYESLLLPVNKMLESINSYMSVIINTAEREFILATQKDDAKTAINIEKNPIGLINDFYQSKLNNKFNITFVENTKRGSAFSLYEHINEGIDEIKFDNWYNNLLIKSLNNPAVRPWDVG